MFAAGLLIGLNAIGQASPAVSRPSVDTLTLRDGQVVRGQILDSDRRAPLLMLVRRSWASANLAERTAAWEKAENPVIRKAEAQRLERLIAWKRDRKPDPDGNDRITTWIDRELTRLGNRDDRTKSPLMIIKLARSEVKAIDRKTGPDQRMVRLGWLADMIDVEVMPRDDLIRAIEGRGFSAIGAAAVSVDRLLPIPIESDDRWLTRRAATEALHNPGGRLIRYQGTILPEPAAGEAPTAGASLDAALGSIKELFGDASVDPLPAKLRELAGQGRAGVVLTQLELAADYSSVRIQTTLWARRDDRWFPALVRSSSVRPDDLPANAADGLADDPQVQAAFGVVERLGLGAIPPELKKRSLNMGAATRQALGLARGAIDRDLDELGLSLEAPRQASAPAKP